jgi:plasmid stabilization system protein ParE
MGRPLAIEWGDQAATELEELLAYIAERNPSAANNVRDQIWSAVEHLSEYPQTGHPADELGVFIKPLSRYPYLVFYKVVGQELHILHVRHGARRHPGFQEAAAEFAR